MPSKFSITIPCKPYTKRFLEYNYGIPVDFTRDQTLYPNFREKLKRKSTRHDNAYTSLSLDKYCAKVEVKINEDDFYNHGWELTITEIVRFNREIEGRAKLFMYLIVSARISFGMNVIDAVKDFQDKFGFTEEIWPTDSIVRDCRRNMTVHKNEMIDNVSELIDKIIVEKLSEKGTIFHNTKNKNNKVHDTI